MKRSISTILVVLVLMNVMGYYGLLVGLQYRNAQNLISQINAGTFSDADTESLKIPLPGNPGSQEYDRVDGEFEKDSLGRVKRVNVTDEESRRRRNYQKGNVINYLDGDSLTVGVSYDSTLGRGYGQTTLISDKSRVIKGGSWNDRPYWLSPGTRRFLEEDQASSTVGFRCAMDRLGSPEGNGRKTGIEYKQRRQNNRKR